MGVGELGLSDSSDCLFSSDEAEFSLRAKLFFFTTSASACEADCFFI